MNSSNQSSDNLGDNSQPQDPPSTPSTDSSQDTSTSLSPASQSQTTESSSDNTINQPAVPNTQDTASVASDNSTQVSEGVQQVNDSQVSNGTPAASSPPTTSVSTDGSQPIQWFRKCWAVGLISVFVPVGIIFGAIIMLTGDAYHKKNGGYVAMSQNKKVGFLVTTFILQLLVWFAVFFMYFQIR